MKQSPNRYDTEIAQELLDRLDNFVQYWNHRSDEEKAAMPKELRWFAMRLANRYKPGRLVPATMASAPRAKRKRFGFTH